MRTTLRRSCDACAKAKHSCDLQTPRCSRCTKRKSACVYANEPLTSSRRTHIPPSSTPRSSRVVEKDGEVSSAVVRHGRITSRTPESSVGLLNPVNASLDPFDSYPPTRLPRAHVQLLIHHCNHPFPIISFSLSYN
jgi:hypothetical protein